MTAQKERRFGYCWRHNKRYDSAYGSRGCPDCHEEPVTTESEWLENDLPLEILEEEI